MIKWKLNISTWTATQHRQVCMLLVRMPPKRYLHVLKTFPQSLHRVLSFDSPQANNMSKSKTKCTSQHKFSNSEIRCITCFSLAKKMGCFNYKNYFHNNVNEELFYISPLKMLIYMSGSESPTWVNLLYSFSICLEGLVKILNSGY